MGWDTYLEAPELVKEPGYNKGSVHRGEVGDKTFYVKNDHEGDRVLDAMAYELMDRMDIVHADGFYDEVTDELVEQAVGEEALLLEEYEENDNDNLPEIHQDTFYDALTAKYVMGDSDFRNNIAVNASGETVPFDFGLSGKSIESTYDRRFIDFAKMKAENIGIEFSYESIYEHIESKTNEIDLESFKEDIEDSLPDGLGRNTVREKDQIIENIKKIQEGFVEDRPQKHKKFERLRS